MTIASTPSAGPTASPPMSADPRSDDAALAQDPATTMVPTSAVTTKENNGQNQDLNMSTAIDEQKTQPCGAPVMRSLSAHPLLSPRARGLKIRIMRFTPSWFSVTMGTGIVNTLLFDLPWDKTHAAFRAIGAAFLVLDIILWVVFALLTVARYIMYPRFFTAMVTHETHSLFLGTIPMGFVMIASGIARTGSEYGIAHSLNIGIVLWWISNVMSVATAFGVPWVMFTKQKHATETLTAAWLLPVVAPIPQAAVGSSLCSLLLEDNRVDYAFTIWIISYIMTGIGTLLAMGLLVLYLQRLVLHRLPPREVIISTFLPLGPCGQAGFALIELGRDAVDMLPRIASMYPDREGLQQLALLGAPLLGAGLLTALVLWGFGVWWAFNAFTSVGIDLFERRIAFNMGFWGLTFPLGSMTLATLSLARLFDSGFFSVLSAIMTFAVTCLYADIALARFLIRLSEGPPIPPEPPTRKRSRWISVFVPTLFGAVRGTLFSAPCLTTFAKADQTCTGPMLHTDA